MYNSPSDENFKKTIDGFWTAFIAGSDLKLSRRANWICRFFWFTKPFISCMGVVIFWLSLERVHPEGYKFF